MLISFLLPEQTLKGKLEWLTSLFIRYSKSCVIWRRFYTKARRVSTVDRRPSTDEAPPIGKTHPFSKITITFEPVMRLSKILVTIKSRGIEKILAPSYFLLPMFLPIPLELFYQQLLNQLCHLEEQKYLGAQKKCFFIQFCHKTANFNLIETEPVVYATKRVIFICL